ncbi:MAG: FtsX-like permease family protein [Verrucomicrobiae bacterium]|nr:FtsX-like permease family protein [Verrucomicrobiae bacterium]
MNLGTFILKNALRNLRRALLCVLSVAACLFLLVSLLVCLRELTVPPEDVGASLRIAVRNKVSLTVQLPARQGPVIARIPGVVAVTPFSWFGGQFGNEEGTPFAQFGVDPAKFAVMFPDMRLPADQLAAWIATRTGCIVGRDLAAKKNLRPGSRITLRGSVWPCDLELVVCGIYEYEIDSTTLFFNHEYLDEATGKTGYVGAWWVLAQSAASVPDVVARINAAFANTSAEVRAETENAFRMGFVSMLGDIAALIGSICTVVVFTLGIVTASTMSMAVRERFPELAILKAMGFRTRELWAFILAESFLLAALGAALGIASAIAFYNSPPVVSAMAVYLPVFEISPRIMAKAAAVAAGLGIVASLAPAFQIARLTVVEGLRTLD